MEVTRPTIEFDDGAGILRIQGVRYSYALFQHLGNDALLPVKVPFEITRREGDGALVVTRLDVLHVPCAGCGEYLSEQGALWFGVPDTHDQSKKLHLCKACNEKMHDALVTFRHQRYMQGAGKES